MKRALLALALVFALFTPKAHANTCVTDRLYNASINFFEGYLASIGTYHSTVLGNISGSTCSNNPVSNREITYARTGQPTYWEAFYGTTCYMAGDPSALWLESQIYYKPTTWQFFGQFGCFCYPPNGTPTCGWM